MSVKLTTAEFIIKANKKHNNLYDYSNTVYTKSRDKLKICCSIHGEFTQIANGHLSGSGCGKCANNIRLTNSEFVSKCGNVHHNLYTYENCNYVSMVKEVTVTCTKHGDFTQLANNHSVGVGCPKCQHSKAELYISWLLEDLGVEYISQKKFKDCIYKRELPFDFYIPSENLCIEYDGRHHKEPVPRGTQTQSQAIRELELVQIKDDIKTNFCTDTGINLLRISHEISVSEFSKLINNALVVK